MAPEENSLFTDDGFANFLGKIVAQPKYGYGPIVALRSTEGHVTKFLKLDPVNDSFVAGFHPPVDE